MDSSQKAIIAMADPVIKAANTWLAHRLAAVTPDVTYAGAVIYRDVLYQQGSGHLSIDFQDSRRHVKFHMGQGKRAGNLHQDYRNFMEFARYDIALDPTRFAVETNVQNSSLEPIKGIRLGEGAKWVQSRRFGFRLDATTGTIAELETALSLMLIFHETYIKND